MKALTLAFVVAIAASAVAQDTSPSKDGREKRSSQIWRADCAQSG